MLAIVMSAISVNYTVIQEIRIPIEMCAAETCIIDGKHTSLVKCVRETHIPRDTCAGYMCGTHYTWGNTHHYDNRKNRSGRARHTIDYRVNM